MNGFNMREAQAQALNQTCAVLSLRLRGLFAIDPAMQELRMLVAQVQELSGCLAFTDLDPRAVHTMTTELATLKEQVDQMVANCKMTDTQAA
ncbi:hypothetical protein [Limimaricola sp. AA108-03]|uniref:hypothetical protein n=1 Tax=Limimaricola sp. AA108-03 TaxID=3425945 RepID=UPI003D77FB28